MTAPLTALLTYCLTELLAYLRRCILAVAFLVGHGFT